MFIHTFGTARLYETRGACPCYWMWVEGARNPCGPQSLGKTHWTQSCRHASVFAPPLA